jgi:hypothetical protein
METQNHDTPEYAGKSEEVLRAAREMVIGAMAQVVHAAAAGGVAVFYGLHAILSGAKDKNGAAVAMIVFMLPAAVVAGCVWLYAAWAWELMKIRRELLAGRQKARPAQRSVYTMMLGPVIALGALWFMGALDVEGMSPGMQWTVGGVVVAEAATIAVLLRVMLKLRQAFGGE